jgi:hypothetical protein
VIATFWPRTTCSWPSALRVIAHWLATDGSVAPAGARLPPIVKAAIPPAATHRAIPAHNRRFCSPPKRIEWPSAQRVAPSTSNPSQPDNPPGRDSPPAAPSARPGRIRCSWRARYAPSGLLRSPRRETRAGHLTSAATEPTALGRRGR